MKTAKKAAFGALAATVMAMFGPVTAASADNPGDTFTHGCGFNTDENQIATNGQNEGVIYVAGISQDGTPPTPSGATVSCWIEVNGVQATPALTVHGTGVIVGAAQISFTAVDGDQVNECMQVTFDDGSPWVGPGGGNPDCPAATTITIPPPVVQSLLDTLFLTVIDPTVCPILITLGQLTGGGIAGVVTIGPDGDLGIADPLGLGINPIEDCPPYINPPA